MGGTDDPNNLIELSIKEHALWHWCNWQLWNTEYDKIAWLALTKQIDIPEAKRQAQLAGARIGGIKSSQIRKEKGNTIGDWNKRTQHVRTIATPESCKKGGSIVGRMLVESGRFAEIQKLGSHKGGKASAAIVNKRKYECSECGFISTAGGVGNHQKRTKHQGKRRVE